MTVRSTSEPERLRIHKERSSHLHGFRSAVYFRVRDHQVSSSATGFEAQPFDPSHASRRTFDALSVDLGREREVIDSQRADWQVARRKADFDHAGSQAVARSQRVVCLMISNSDFGHAHQYDVAMLSSNVSIWSQVCVDEYDLDKSPWCVKTCFSVRLLSRNLHLFMLCKGPRSVLLGDGHRIEYRAVVCDKGR
jgi:hypothetical protein